MLPLPVVTGTPAPSPAPARTRSHYTHTATTRTAWLQRGVWRWYPSQMCVSWCREARTLFTAGVSGVVYGWDAQFMEEKYHMGGLSRDGTCVRCGAEDCAITRLHCPAAYTPVRLAGR